MRKPICFLLALLLSVPPIAQAVSFDNYWGGQAGETSQVYFGNDYPTQSPGDAIAGEGSAVLAGDFVSWYVEDGTTLYLSGQGAMYDFPNGAPWALYKDTLTRVVLEGSITTVGAYSFHDFDALTSVEFGSSLVEIGAGAFYSCDALTSVTLPASFKKFGTDCFRSCINLQQIHCSGNFPRFDENCLWDTGATIYYSVNNPWPVSLVEQLETAFHNRIEFRASDGTDPYVPTEATQPVYIPETTYPTEIPTYPTEAPTYSTETPTYPTQPVQTVPTTVPTTQPEPTRETFLMATQPTQVTRPPEPVRRDDSIIGVLIILITLTMMATATLLFRVSHGSGSRKKRKKR